MVEEQADNSTHRTMTVMLLLSDVSTVLTALMVEEQADNSNHRTVTVMLLLSRLYSSHKRSWWKSKQTIRLIEQ